MVNISENLEVLEGVKDDIKTAIENKGIVINDTTPFVDYATKINEISIGTGDYQDGYEQGKLDQKALLENRTFRRNGTYSRPDGYGTVVVDVPSGGTGDYDTGFEDGVAAQKAKLTNITITYNGTYTNEDGYNEVVVDVDGDESRYEEGYQDGYYQGEEHQKSLMTTATFTRNGTYTREDGYNEVVVNVPSTLYPQFFGVLSDTIGINYNQIFNYMASDGDIWVGKLWGYVELNPDKTSNGMMYEFDSYSDIDRAPIESVYIGDGDLDVLNLSATIDNIYTNHWGMPVWGKKSLVTPWVYNANNSPTTTKILPDCILGGFECDEVEYINRVFEGAETLRVFQWLHNLGKSFTSVNTLDLSILTKLNYDIYGVDSFIEIANSVYDFAVDGMNVNGISYSNVKLPTTVSQEAIDAWIAKGWRVLQ